MTNPQKSFWILGGDLRQHWLAKLLAQEGHQVKHQYLDADLLKNNNNISKASSLEDIKAEDIILLPLPVSKDQQHLHTPFYESPVTLKEVFSHFHRNQQVFAGQIKENAYKLGEKCNLRDYMKEEALIIANAVPTAEGCIQIAMERLPTTIQGASILVLGYGNVGKATAKRFQALGGNVSVSVRSSAALAQVKSDCLTGFSLNRLSDKISSYHCVVNTIPSIVLEEAQLSALSATALVIDLASNTGGVDLKAAEKLERPIISALSLPGKVAPQTAANIIKDSIFHILKINNT